MMLPQEPSSRESSGGRGAPDPAHRDGSAALTAVAVLLGFITGLLLWGLLLGAEYRRYEPGLWTLRFRHVIACGLDYNGPPYTAGATLWLTCGEERGWQVWPWSR